MRRAPEGLSTIDPDLDAPSWSITLPETVLAPYAAEPSARVFLNSSDDTQNGDDKIYNYVNLCLTADLQLAPISIEHSGLIQSSLYHRHSLLS